MRVSRFINFIKTETFSSFCLFSSALVAIILSNSPLAIPFHALWHTEISVQLGQIGFAKPLEFWINDGLMTLFFLLVGLELKREFLQGELASLSQIILPGMSALGGMIVPAFIYVLFNWQHAETISGWSVPVATDIAFALGVLSLFGKRVPLGLKLFLMALAIFDDLGAILIIAFFHTPSLYLSYGLIALIIVVLLKVINPYEKGNAFVYGVLGIALWLAVLNSGVHATIAGVLLAFLIPLHQGAKQSSPLLVLEKALHPWVAFFIMPLFALANAGLSFQSHDLIGNGAIVLGVSVGLFLGKPLGVMSFAWVAVRLKWAKLPYHTTWRYIFGVSMLCGIGFTMSLFLGTLTFQNETAYLTEIRFGVLLGSLLSGIAGSIALSVAFAKKTKI
jgi:NhaA family Na+:H+ antiporter